VSLFNGIDRVLEHHNWVVLKDDKIINIVNKTEIEFTENYYKIDGTGKTITPGLVDCHVHIQSNGGVPWQKSKIDVENNLSAYLYSGITTVYDLGGISKKSEKIKDQQRNGELFGPNIFHTHMPITVKNSHPIPLSQQLLPWPLKSLANTVMPTIKSPEHAQKLLKSYTSQKIDYVKLICDQIPEGSPEMDFESMKAICDESHRLGFKVFAHIGSPQNAVDAVNAGADVLAHGIWRGKLSDEQAQIIANSGIPIIYTLAGFQNVNNINHGHFFPSELDELLIPNNVINPVKDSNGLAVHNEKVMKDFFNDVSKNEPHWLSNFKLLKNKNVPIIVGTDSSFPGTYAGSTYYQELKELSKFGLSNYQILQGATYLASRLFLATPDFGTVEIGKKANLLLLNGNPLHDLGTIETPQLIFINGEIVKRK
jgi:imidazolonepropionase-like amidohydrolase